MFGKPSAEDRISMPERELQQVSNQLSLGRYLSGLRTRREFIVLAPLNNLRAANMDTVLGSVWFLANPALSISTYFLVFGVLLKVDRGVDNYLGYLVVGVVVFNLLTQTMVKASRSMAASALLIRSLYFPRAIIPLSATIEGVYTFAPSVGVMLVAVSLSGETPGARWLLLAPALVLVVILVAGLVFVTARLGSIYRDLSSLLPHTSRLLFYGSGVLYYPAARIDNEWALRLFEWNPFYLAMLLPRHALLGTHAGISHWAIMGAWSVGAFLFGFVFFWRGESSYGV